MDYDEYVHHIAQKYRLAVAISVIRSKPNNVSIEEYLLQLQTKIRDTEIDPNETVCSDDFNFDPTPCANNKSNTQTDRTKCDTANEISLDYFGNENGSEGIQTILNDFVFENGIESNINVRREVDSEDTIKVLKNVATDITEKHNANQNLSQITFCESQESVNTDNDITYCRSTTTNPLNVIEINGQNQNGNDNIDSQETQLYTLHGFTQNYTHVSQTQEEYFVIPDKYIRNKAHNGHNMQNNLEDANKYNGDRTELIHNINQNVLTQNDFAIAIEEARNTLQSENVTKKVAINFDADTKGDENMGVTQNVVTYVENDRLAQTFEFNILNIDELTDNSKRATAKDICKDRTLNLYGTNENADLNNDTLLSFDSNTPKESTNINNTLENIAILHKDSNVQYNKEIVEPDIPIQQSTEGIVNEHEMEVDESDSDENTQERVPFKVLEELNRVKCFLNRRDRRNDGGYSTDSGYRSDSKSRSLKSYKPVQVISTDSQLFGTYGAWLNQSAYSLFNHILQTSDTDNIVKEIAQVLGQLIDKLHDEENYPPFLEGILESVDRMVKETYGGGGWADKVIITKDGNIQRLILLNKSKHILQYTIEKITTILEELHANLTQKQENLHELSNIVEVENVSYIFHILEIFLKRYMKVKDASSQSTQNSQEDSLPKRSSLTELWRKKWNPNSKEVIKNENKTCVLKRCSDILNKIIVECLDGYSLVAFAALQCLNLIQV